jgi:hypothetical protein
LNDFEFDVKAKTLKVTVRRQGQEKVKRVKEVPRTPQELQALLDDPPGDLTLDEGEEIPTCSQTDGLPAIVTSFTGTASKVGVDPAPGQDSGAQVRISGKFAFRGTLDLGASTVTLNLLLDESDSAGELVQGIDGADSVPSPSSPAEAGRQERPSSSPLMSQRAPPSGRKSSSGIRRSRSSTSSCASTEPPCLCRPSFATSSLRPRPSRRASRSTTG